MSKTAIVFPGQGAQHVGMGQSFYENSSEAKAVFDAASQALGFAVDEMCFNGPEDDLRKTENTQPTILTASYAGYQALVSLGVDADVVAGLSLGEYTALVAAGAMSFDDAVKTVKLRGKYMQEEVPDGVGTMAAILGLSDEKVEEACEKASDVGVVEPANYNCPKQLVVAGEVKAVERAVEIATELGALKAVMLPVSAPFHSSMLVGAGEKLSDVLKTVAISDLEKQVYANVDAKPYAECSQVVDQLVAQVSSPVRWAESVRNMIADGVDVFIEVGPGKALSKFIKKIDRSVTIITVNDWEGAEQAAAKLKELGRC